MTELYLAFSTNDGVIADCGWSPGEGFLGVYKTPEEAQRACEDDWDELMDTDNLPFPGWKEETNEDGYPNAWNADEDEFHYRVMKSGL